MQEKPELLIFGGPNGSGKSSILKSYSSKMPAYYINADDIAKAKVNAGDLNSLDEKTRNKINLEAAKEADTIRTMAIEEKRSFTTESVMSTDKGINIMRAAQKNGFHVHLVYILTSSPEINIERIQSRVAKGGHPVPEEKVISRYNRCMELLPEEIHIASVVEVYDNSLDTPALILEKTLDKEIRIYPQEQPNNWTRDSLEEIKAKVEAIERLEELIASPDEKGHIKRTSEISISHRKHDPEQEECLPPSHLQRKTLIPGRLYGPGTLILDEDKATLKLSPNLLFCVPRELLADKPYKTGDVIRVQSLRHTKEGLIIREADKIKRKDIER